MQGVHHYADADPDRSVPGLMHVDLGGYHVRDIEFTAAFDIDRDKVGKDLSEAIPAGQNNTLTFADVPRLDVPVMRGMTHDGLGKYLQQKIEDAPGETDDIVQVLKQTKTDVVVSYLPVGSEQATKWYVEQVLEAGYRLRRTASRCSSRSRTGWGGRFPWPACRSWATTSSPRSAPHRSSNARALFADRGVRLARTWPECRRQHGLLQHARARAARSPEDPRRPRP